MVHPNLVSVSVLPLVGMKGLLQKPVDFREALNVQLTFRALASDCLESSRSFDLNAVHLCAPGHIHKRLALRRPLSRHIWLGCGARDGRVRCGAETIYAKRRVSYGTA
jgi:hypothetical protein